MAVTQRLRAALVEGRATSPSNCCSRTGTAGAAPSGSASCTTRSSACCSSSRCAHLYPSQNPSEAERMAIVATGGYGRGVLAPGSDIDLLFLLPYKQTAWGESVAEAILYCLWDMGLKVGHATRSVNECIRQAKADMTIRTARPGGALSARRAQAVRRAGRPASTRRSCRAPAPNSSPPSSPSARSATAAPGSRAIWSSPTSRTARAACAICTRSIWIAKYVYRVREREELIENGVFDRARIPAVPPLRRFPVGGALPHALPHRPRRGAAVVRHPARDRGAARLHRASRACATSSAS